MIFLFDLLLLIFSSNFRTYFIFEDLFRSPSERALQAIDKEDVLWVTIFF
jgi:hypothetical protein